MFPLLATFYRLCDERGVPLAPERTEGPASMFTFLGTELDSAEACSRLPEAKLVKLRELLQASLWANSLSLHELQVLVGHLNFACRVVAPGHPFLQRLCDAMAVLKKPQHRIKVSAAMQADLSTWLEFLHDFNGISFWQDKQMLEADLQVHSDAAGVTGSASIFWAIGALHCGPGIGSRKRS